MFCGASWLGLNKFCGRDFVWVSIDLAGGITYVNYIASNKNNSGILALMMIMIYDGDDALTFKYMGLYNKLCEL